jgi:hypothetical protein
MRGKKTTFISKEFLQKKFIKSLTSQRKNDTMKKSVVFYIYCRRICKDAGRLTGGNKGNEGMILRHADFR